MHRNLFGLVVVGLIFSLAYGAAAGVQVTSGVVQAGGDSQDAHFRCDSDGVTVSYQVFFGGNPPAFRISQATVSGIGPGCQSSLRLAIVLTDQTGSKLRDAVAYVGSQGQVTFSVGDPPVSDVYDVHVAIWKEP